MFKEIIEDFKEFRSWLREYLFYRRYAIKMNMAIILADLKQLACNMQCHVMIMCLPGSNKERLVAVNKDDIERYKQMGWIPKNKGMFDLKHGGSFFYSTPLNRNNKSTPEERRAAKEKYRKYVGKYMK